MIEYNPRRQKDKNAAGEAIIIPSKIDTICVNNERDSDTVNRPEFLIYAAYQ
jgi:hypothetical protein